MPIVVNGEITLTGWLALVGGSTVLAALVTWTLTTFNEWRKSGRSQKFAGLYVAITFERFADACASAIQASHNYDASDGELGGMWRNLPAFPDWESEVDWHALSITHTQHSLTLLSDIGAARTMLSGLWDFDDDETVRLTREKCADLGLASLGWASDLRNSLGLVKRKPSEWDVKAYLAERSEEYAKLRGEREKRNRELNAALGS